jgi:hypothetical protein
LDEKPRPDLDIISWSEWFEHKKIKAASLAFSRINVHVMKNSKYKYHQLHTITDFSID